MTPFQQLEDLLGKVLALDFTYNHEVFEVISPFRACATVDALKASIRDPVSGLRYYLHHHGHWAGRIHGTQSESKGLPNTMQDQGWDTRCP